MLDWKRRISRLRPSRGRTVRLHETGEGDDTTLARRMRAAALAVHVDGRRCMGLPEREAAAVRRLNRQAEALHGVCLKGGEALESMVRAGRMMEACAAQARLDRVGDLPASGEKPRILMAAEALVGSGGVQLTGERIMLAIASFDEVQALEMAELWSVPEALRICMSRAYVDAAQACIQIAADRGQAERWAAGEEIRLSDASPAFFEHALQIVQEQEDHARREKLEAHLLKDNRSPEDVVHQAHRDASVIRMRIENLLAGKRLLDGLDWGKCFEQLSNVESELQYDPSGIYTAMEDDSRAVVRREIAVLARRLNVGELTVARHAVSAAQAARYAGKPERMCTVCCWLCDDEGRAALAQRMGAEGARLPLVVRDRRGIKSA